MLTYRAPRSDTDSKLLPYESVVDALGNVMERLSVIRTEERGSEVKLSLFDFQTEWAALMHFPVILQTPTHLL